MITEDDEARYGLPPLPEVPFIGVAECRRLNARYEAERAEWRRLHPHAEKVD